jgi:hypothetical protein
MSFNSNSDIWIVRYHSLPAKPSSPHNSPYQIPVRLTNHQQLQAGAFAAFSVDLMVYPLDTLKTRIQSPNYTRLYTHASTGSINRAVLFRGLYQGLWSVVLATIPSCMLPSFSPATTYIYIYIYALSPLHRINFSQLTHKRSRRILHNLRIRQTPPHHIHLPPHTPNPHPCLQYRGTSLLLHSNPSRSPQTKCPNDLPLPTA